MALSFRYIDLVDAATHKYNGTESAAAAKLCNRPAATDTQLLDALRTCNGTSADGTSSGGAAKLSDYQVGASKDVSYPTGWQFKRLVALWAIFLGDYLGNFLICQ